MSQTGMVAPGGVSQSFEEREKLALEFAQKSIDWNYKNAQWAGQLFRSGQIAALIFSVLVTVLSGISAVRDKIGWLVTVVAGLGTIANGVLTLTRVQERQRLTMLAGADLVKERFMYLEGVGPYAEPDREKRLGIFSTRMADAHSENAKQLAVSATAGTVSATSGTGPAPQGRPT
jgi:hypothetical protein